MGMREKLIELVSDAELPMKNDGRIIGWYALDFHGALYMADHLIANDVVPVVRCKDCKYYYDYGVNREYCCHRSKDGRQVFDVKFKADDFCSYGVRKDNG